MSELKYRNKSWLHRKYVKEQKSGYEIADLCNACVATIYSWLERLGIPRRSNAKAQRRKGSGKDMRYRNKDWLKTKYLEEEKSIPEIAMECDAAHGTIGKWLGKFNIATRSSSESTILAMTGRKKYQNKTWLKEKYIEEQFSVKGIADMCDAGIATVWRWLKKYDIAIRRRSESPSDGELRIRDILENRGIKYEREYSFVGLKDKEPLWFDFAIFNQTGEISQLIEFQGIQHYKPVGFFGGEEAFAKIKEHDKMKKKYCAINDIPLTVIPHKEKENLKNILPTEA